MTTTVGSTKKTVYILNGMENTAVGYNIDATTGNYNGDIDISYRIKNTAIVEQNRNAEYVELIAKLSDNKYDKNRGELTLSFACRNNLPDLVDKMIASGVNVNADDDHQCGHTPLHHAALNGHVIVAEKLISNNADVNNKNKNGSTPLHYAALNGIPNNLVEKLISNNADVNNKNKNGYTPLHYAALNGHVDVVEKLISNKADVNNNDDFGSTPLYEAVRYENLMVVKKLVESGANIDDMKPSYSSYSLFELVAKNKEMAEYFAKVKIERQKEKAKNDEKIAAVKQQNKEPVIVPIVKTNVTPSLDVIEMVKKAFKERNIVVFKFLIESQKIDKTILRETFKDEITMFMFMEQVKLIID
jgi:ankyrin repeat protein